LHDDRIRLWDEFNRAWLATLQRQNDLTQEMIQSGQGLHESQSIISTQGLEQLARELVRLCDDVEKHGLVDYQMGVAEEDIMDREFWSFESYKKLYWQTTQFCFVASHFLTRRAIDQRIRIHDHKALPPRLESNDELSIGSVATPLGAHRDTLNGKVDLGTTVE
jgi:hypothetical protein